jgi:hypothetical protein
MIPKLSAPLVKDIRTGEGILEYVLGVLGAIAGVTGNLSIAKTGLYITILAVSKGVRRGLIKLVALQNGVIGAPTEPVVLTTLSHEIVAGVDSIEPSVESVLASIDAAEKAATALQNKPGTPAAEVKAGLAPEPEPAVKK